jgi:Mor family transcriptional regulator
MYVQRTAVRNREIFAAYQQGGSIRQLAQRYELAEVTVYQIIRVELHKVAVSEDAFYQEMRSQKPLE